MPGTSTARNPKWLKSAPSTAKFNPQPAELGDHIRFGLDELLIMGGGFKSSNGG
jgi:hypothetical protein